MLPTQFKLAFNITPTVVVALDIENSWLCVCYTLEQYAEFDRKRGPFQHQRLSMVGKVTLETVPPAQELSGLPAQMLADGLLEILQRGVPPDVFRQGLSPGGISSVNWRQRGSVATVVFGLTQEPFFAVVFDTGQLRAVQRKFFPDEPWRFAAFQSGARLPVSSDESVFVVTGDAALQCIQGCWLRSHLG